VSSNSSSAVVAGPRPRRLKTVRRFTTGRLVWPGLLRVMQKLTHYKRSDLLEFKINFSVRELLAPRGRAVKDQVEALVQAVQKAGSYQAKDEAVRAMHAVMDALKDRVPPEVLIKLSESLPVREGAHLRRAVAQRMQREQVEQAAANPAAASVTPPVADVDSSTGGPTRA
jgi:ABC-type nitrate/sulfonate/bicarbonate transport system substrate-binding protein